MTNPPVDLPDTPVGRRVRWYLERLRDPKAPSEAELEANFEPTVKFFAPPIREQRAWDGMTAWAGLGNATVAARSDTELDIEGTTDEGRRWRQHFVVHSETGRFTEFLLEWVQDETITVREATVEDGPVLADIERRSPLVLGETKVTIDRGDDYFATARLMENVTVVMAEVDGIPGAVQGAAAHTACIGGTPYRMGYFHHLRILPEHQRKGLMQKLGQAVNLRYTPPQVDGNYAYVAEHNAASRRLFSFADPWPVQPLMCELAVAAHAGGEMGRTATVADAATIVEVLNTCHADEEMFCPYTVDSLTARLERVPAQYGWSNLRRTDGAVVGVWPAGLRTITDDAGGRRVHVEAYVLDHGFLPGAEQEYEALLRAWCAELHRRGITTLMTFTSAHSPNYDTLRRMEAYLHPFDLFVFGPPVPDGAEGRGVYVDLVYF